MRTDEELRQMVLDELEREQCLKRDGIGVRVEDERVALSGTVESYVERSAAISATSRVPGIRGVLDQLVIELPYLNQRTDDEVAAAAEHALTWDVMVPHQHINVHVEDGVLTISGVVKYGYEKAAAESAVRNLVGIKGLENLIFVERHADWEVVKKAISRQMHRTAERDIDGIKVEMHDGTATLRGTVRTLAEREEAERAARSVPGVAVVNNFISLSF